MKKQDVISRRSLLKIGGSSIIALSATKLLGSICEGTPIQPKGPFYPVKDQADKNNDLTVVNSSGQVALGDIIYLSGKVTDHNCNPIQNVVVEIWQACYSGRYNHPGDQENNNPLDENFQYWGITTTSSDGSYNFKTIIPGHYVAAPGWIRPPHIHFKVYKNGYKEKITQMYFANNQYNNDDKILNNIPNNEKPLVVREKIARSSENGRNAFDMEFDITIERV